MHVVIHFKERVCGYLELKFNVMKTVGNFEINQRSRLNWLTCHNSQSQEQPHVVYDISFFH